MNRAWCRSAMNSQRIRVAVSSMRIFLRWLQIQKSDSTAQAPGRRFDAVLLDIDHSPEHWLNTAHGGFYTAAGLRALSAQLLPQSVFALWSNASPSAPFLAVLDSVFASVEAHVVSFANPYSGAESSCTVYVSLTASL